MAIIIRVVRLVARYFLFLWEFIGFLYFLDCTPRILGDSCGDFKGAYNLDSDLGVI